MVLAAVDDLLFSSKIRTVAKQIGVEVVFARTPQDILTQARTRVPSLAIFDLNSAQVQPLETIAALKADVALRSIRTVGFVSHVQTGLIEAARTAGADEVMARSGFTLNLAEILAAGK